MLDWVDRDRHKDDMFAFEFNQGTLLASRYPMGEKKLGLDIAPRGSYQLLADWASGETSLVNYQIIFKDDPVSVSLYAPRGMASLAHLVGRIANATFCNVKILARMANQVKF